MRRRPDADGVATLFAYNAKGEPTTTATDVNGNDSIDFGGTDRIAVTETVPGTHEGHAVWTTTTKVYATINNPTPTTVDTRHASTDGLRQWAIPAGSPPSSSVTALGTNGNWTNTATDPDGTKTVSTYTGGLLDRVERRSADASPVVVSFAEYGYDALNRLETTTDSRTGTTSTAYLSATADFVASVTDPGTRETKFTYDSRGRRTHVDAPDTFDPSGAPNNTDFANITETIYNPDGTVQEVTGAQTYRVTHTYDYAGRMKTMTTYGTQTATTTWSYSGTTGHLLDKIYQGGKATSYTYTDAGRLQTRAWARKVNPANPSSPRVTTTYAYAAGLLDTVTYNDGVTRDIEYTYNRLGKVEAVLQGANTAGGNDNLHEFEYDDSSDFRLLHETITYGDGADLATNPHLRRRLFHTADGIRRSTGFELAAPGTGGSWLASEHANLYSYDTAGRFARVKDDQDRYHSYLYTADSAHLVRWIYRGHGLTGGGGITDNRMLTFVAYEPTRDLMQEQRNIVAKTVHEVASSYIYTANDICQRTAVSTTTVAGTAYSDGSYNWEWGYNSKGEVVKADHTGSGNTAADRFYVLNPKLIPFVITNL